MFYSKKNAAVKHSRSKWLVTSGPFHSSISTHIYEGQRRTAYLSKQSPHNHREGANCPTESWVSNQRIPAIPLKQNALDSVGLKHLVQRQVHSCCSAQSTRKRRKTFRQGSKLPTNYHTDKRNHTIKARPLIPFIWITLLKN